MFFYRIGDHCILTNIIIKQQQRKIYSVLICLKTQFNNHYLPAN